MRDAVALRGAASSSARLPRADGVVALPQLSVARDTLLSQGSVASRLLPSRERLRRG